MNYKIIFVEHLIDERYKKQIWEILVALDKEFTPPLSERISSFQKNLKKDTIDANLPYNYFEALLNQRFILSVNDHDEILGFRSFKHKHILPDLKEIGEVNYFTTLCVKKGYHGMGIGTAIHDYTLNNLPSHYYHLPFASRTWSTNEASKKLLLSHGFKIVKRLENHRGKGLDTIYFVRDVDSMEASVAM